MGSAKAGEGTVGHCGYISFGQNQDWKATIYSKLYKMMFLDFQYLKSLLTPFQGRGCTFKENEKYEKICSARCGWGTFVSGVLPEDLHRLVLSVALDEWELILVEAIWAGKCGRKSKTRGDKIGQSTLMRGSHVIKARKHTCEIMASSLRFSKIMWVNLCKETRNQACRFTWLWPSAW